MPEAPALIRITQCASSRRKEGTLMAIVVNHLKTSQKDFKKVPVVFPNKVRKVNRILSACSTARVAASPTTTVALHTAALNTQNALFQFTTPGDAPQAARGNGAMYSCGVSIPWTCRLAHRPTTADQQQIASAVLKVEDALPQATTGAHGNELFLGACPATMQSYCSMRRPAVSNSKLPALRSRARSRFRV